MASLSLMSDTGFALGTDDPKEARSTLKTNVANYNTTVGVLNGGTSGQVLTSQGAGNQPVFTSLATGAGELLFSAAMPSVIDVTGDATVFPVTNWSGVWLDVGSNFNLVSGIYVTPTSGYYSVLSQVTLTTASATGERVGLLKLLEDNTPITSGYSSFTPIIDGYKRASIFCHHASYTSANSGFHWSVTGWGGASKDMGMNGGITSQVAIYRWG